MGRLARLIACAAVAVVASSCASPFHKRTARLDLRPVPIDQPGTTADDPGYYAAAVSAIEARDYARALDLLQVARARKADDPAVLNAFGVVYDKLGRLDLSGRYYAQARQVDPGSKIVQHNIAYSDRLRTRSIDGDAAGTAVARAAPAEPVVEPLRAAVAPAHFQVRIGDNGALLIGRGVRIVDASGVGVGEDVRLRLATRGWTVRKAPPPRVLIQARSTLSYPEGGAAIAAALARTLHNPVRMGVCQDKCRQVTLVIGQDARRSSTRGGA